MFRLFRSDQRLLKLVGVAVLAGACGAWLFSFGLATATGEGDTVAVANGQAITREVFYATLEREAGERVLNQLISEALVLGAEKSRNMKVTDTDMGVELSRIKANYADDAAFQEALARYNLSTERLHREIRLSLILRRLASEGIQVSDEEIKAFFEENKESLGTPEQVRASHILVDSKEAADRIIGQLKKGGDFTALAKEHSKDAGSAGRGGDLGHLTHNDQIVPEFKRAVFSMKTGETSEPVKTEYGYHVIRVTGKTPAQPANFSAQKEYIKGQLIEEKSRSYDDVIAELKRAAKVDVKWERYRALATLDSTRSGN